MIDGKQLTVIWHVDDLKVSHEDPKVIDKFISNYLHREDFPLLTVFLNL